MSFLSPRTPLYNQQHRPSLRLRWRRDWTSPSSCNTYQKQIISDTCESKASGMTQLYTTSPLLDATTSHRKIDPVDRFEDFVVPALLHMNRGSAVEHKALRGTRPPICGTSPPSFPDCPECRNRGLENGFKLHCESCLVNYASQCDDDNCDISQACFNEECATECVDADCQVDPCFVPTCGAEPVVYTTTCFNENCFLPTAHGQLSGFDPQLCEQGECYGFLQYDSGIQQDFSLGHNISDHYPPAPSPHDAPLWNHSIPPYYPHPHDHHANTNTNHKRRRTGGGSSRSSLQGDNCYQPQFDWQAFQTHYGPACPSSTFQQQQDQDQPSLLNSSWQINQFEQNVSSSGDFGTNLRDSQGPILFPYSPDLTSSTSNSYLASPTIFPNSNDHTSFLSHSSFPSNLTRPAVSSVAETLDGLTCQLSHISGFEGSRLTSDIPCSPHCSAPRASSKLTRPRSPATKGSRLVNSDSAPSIADVKRSNRQSIEVTTCQWEILDLDNSLEPKTCCKTFSCAKELDEHVQKEHTNKLGAQQFVCGWLGCKTSFKHRGKLNRHISGAHSRYHAHHCTHCERTFCTKEQLKNHETTHTGEKKYKCSFCDHTSATKTQHNTHERTHTKEKPYACPHCLHRSGDSSNLSKHIKNKHPETRNSPAGQTGRTRVKVEAAG